MDIINRFKVKLELRSKIKELHKEKEKLLSEVEKLVETVKTKDLNRID
jgi:hypothetical protein